MRQLVRMSVDRSLRRLRNLQGFLRGGDSKPLRIEPCRLCSKSAGGKDTVSIGDVSIKITTPKSPELVPKNYLSHDTPQSVLRHLRWIMQKDLLGQDVFLIGSPGPLRRQIAMMYLELTKREAEYVSLSRDTTEADLKQRREIRSGSAFYLDQCAVRAATNGHVLVLEGIEKAERNVLPILNNLLENREMQLEDGRFLVAADRYDKLLQDHTKEELDDLKLVRVDKRFRVIALGLPIPRYQGNPLDPPLRSRFQARDINALPFQEQYEMLLGSASNVRADSISQLLSFASTMITSESNSLGLPDFPIANLQDITKIMDTVPDVSVSSLLKRLYPYDVMLGKEGQNAVIDALNKFGLPISSGSPHHLESVQKVDENRAQVSLSGADKMYTFQVDSGSLELTSTSDKGDFVQTRYHDAFLAEMVQSHLVKDFCVVGSRGCGKSALVKRFAALLGYHIEPIMLYQDMTSRDLVQQRTTLPNGDTTWRLSPLVTAALDGSLAVLDGVHRINAGSFSLLHRLVHDRELQLFDGSRLMGKDKYDKIKEENNFTDQDMADRHIHSIHPGFRIIALAEPPVVGSSSNQWLSPEMLTMFLYHNMRPLTQTEELDVITQLVPNCPDLTKLMSFVHKLRQSSDPTISSIASSLSTRQLIRIARRFASFPSEDLYAVIQKACLARFLPRLPKSALEQSLDEAGIVKVESAEHSIDAIEKSVTCEVKGNKLRIGNTEVDLYNPENRTKVPDVLFYENTQHLSVMEDMLKDFLLGEHLLLVGNQGVGKNKIIDRFLHLLNRPREYIQLHRDTTVQTLTLQPTVQDGVIVYEDSPLVRAVKLGHVLVVDEADKAPTHVTCILKTLVESGEMHLADGRRIVSANSGLAPSEQRIVSHPDFRMVVLANRPGFPFLGNDFFGAMGDIFSAHAIDNPDKESEMSMLRQYGPDVPETTLEKLVLAFGELRDMADQGLIAYPYSTREVVNMVKHLQEYPNEGLTSVVRNVFDFDSYNKELRETLVTTMQKHGIPLGASPDSVQLAKEFPLPKLELLGKWKLASQGSRQKTALMSLPVESRKFGIKGPVTLRVESVSLDRTEARSSKFTEQQAFWEIPMHETNIICDLAVTKAVFRSPGHTSNDVIHIGTANPVCLYSMNPRTMSANFLDMYDIFPVTSGSFRPRIKIAPLAAPLDDSVVVHEEVTNVILLVNVETGEISRITCSTLPQTVQEKRRFPAVGATKSVGFEGSQGKRTLTAANFAEKLTPEGVVEKITAIIDDCPPNPPAAKKRTRKRRFLTSEPTDTSAVMKTKVEEMDEAIQKKCKGTKIVSAKELLAFDKDISPRPPKQKWIMRLRELLVVTPLEDKIPVLCKEGRYICLGGNHRVKALQEMQVEDQEEIKVKITIYEGLTLEECWRLANLDNSQDSLQKAQLTFQDELFQARRLKDSTKMRETLSLVLGTHNCKAKKPNSMGTLCHVARYPERLWALVCLLIDKHEEKFGYSRSLSQPLFRFLQGVNDKCKEEVLNVAVQDGVEKAAKKAREMKARLKLRSHFIQQTGLDSWQEAINKFPEATAEVEKFVDEFIYYLETIIAIAHLSRLLQMVYYWKLSFTRVTLSHLKACQMLKKVKSYSKVQDQHHQNQSPVPKLPNISSDSEKTFGYQTPKVARRQLVPEDFVAFVENSTSERQPEIDIRIQVTVNGQNCDTQYADVLKEHIKNIKDSSPYRLCEINAPDPYGTVIFYEQNGDFLEVLSMLEGVSHTVSLPIVIHDIHQLDTNQWILTEARTNKKYLADRLNATEFVLRPISEQDVDLRLQRISTTSLSAPLLSKTLGENISSPNRVAITAGQYASILVGFPELSTSDVYGILRDPLGDDNPLDKADQLIGNIVGKSTKGSQASSSVYLPECGQVVRSIPTHRVPDGVIARDQKPHVSGFLEVTDMANKMLRYVPVPGATRQSPYSSWLFNLSDSSLLIAGTSNDGLVTVDVGGCVRLWETGLVNLERSLREWKNMIGWQDSKPLQVTYEKESGRTADELPKHGKIDPNNTPHVGGGTWAGGTGGTTTAGLGGFGGPYRLDAGHDVTQVPQWQKDSVPEHVRQAAREMAQKAFKERLREIQMSEYDAENYESFSNSVRRQVQSLRVILDSLQAKGKERQWLKNQTYGDLDDAKLIDGLTGEKSVYKRRGEKEPEMGSPQELPKKLRLLVDVSGSMYRFNSYDGRLEREMETVIMAMEALEGYEEKIKYDIVGHSGEDYKVSLVEFDKPPKNNKERLSAVKIMHAHSQFCLSGDMTLQATKHAVETLATEEADEHFLIVLSDANFDRYGISPRRFGEILRGNEKVNAYAIFIGSLGDQAIRLTKQLPMGHSFVCMDTKNLPQILQQIFTSTMLSTSK